MEKILLPHVPSRVDALTHARIPIVNLEAAAKFGALVTLLPLDISLTPECIPAAIGMLNIALGQEYEDGAWLVCIGDPVIQVAAADWILRRFGRLRLLRWDGQRRIYDTIEVDMDQIHRES